jgi:N12 class adenine-specific DNA methylase
MRILRWISENTWKDMIQNEEISLKIGVTPIDEKMRDSRLRWFDHIQRIAINALVRKSELI